MSSLVGTFNPTSLFAGDGPFDNRAVMFATAGVAGVVLRGTVMGRVTSGGTAGAPVAKAGNTGVVAITMDGSTPVQAGATAGVYRIVWTDATHYTVYDPNGDILGSSTNSGGWAANPELKFTVGSPSPAMIAGDEYDVTVSVQDKYIPSKRSATDGSQIPVAISAYDVDVTSVDVVGPAYFNGQFAGEVLVMDASWTIAGLQEAFRQTASQIYVRMLGALG